MMKSSSEHSRAQGKASGHHGGARTGAGRKRTFDDFEELWVGERCEELVREGIRAKFDAELAEKMGKHEIKENHAEIRKAELPLRHLVVEFGVEKLDVPVPDDLPGNVVDAIDAVRDNANSLDKQDGSTPPMGRFYSRVSGTRPKEFRAEITTVVAQEAAERYGIPVSRAAVEKAWKTYKAFAKDLLAQPEFGGPLKPLRS